MRVTVKRLCAPNEENAPDALMLGANADENINLDEGKNEMLVTGIAHQPCLDKSLTCNRCKLKLSRKGSISASINSDCGCQVTYFICANCIIDLQELY